MRERAFTGLLVSSAWPHDDMEAIPMVWPTWNPLVMGSDAIRVGDLVECVYEDDYPILRIACQAVFLGLARSRTSGQVGSILIRSDGVTIVFFDSKWKLRVISSLAEALG